MERKKLERFPEGVLEHIATTIGDYKTGSEIAELLRIAGYPNQSHVVGSKWRFLYETFKEFQATADGQYDVAKVVQAFCDSTQWIGNSPRHKQALETLNEALIHANLQINADCKLVVTAERIAHVTKEELRSSSPEPKQDSGAPSTNPGKPSPRRVFVVHGRNEQIRKAMFSFLRAIGLEPIEWIRAVAMTGKTIPYVGEILDAALRNAQAIVVVMSPDDEARLRPQYLEDGDPEHERQLTPQPRPNVLFEAGLAMGRADDRTILVEVGSIRPFCDIAGRHTIRLDSSPQRRQALASRLRSAGCAVDLSGTDWYTVGNFEISEADEGTVQEASAMTPETSSVQSTTDEITETEVRILKLMAESGEIGLTADLVAAGLGTNQTRVKYCLDRLLAREYVFATCFYVLDTTYYLAEKGRAYLVGHELM